LPHGDYVRRATLAVFASLADLRARMERALVDDEEQSASSALEDASDMARAYGRDWDTTTAPRLVRTLVLRAVVRYMRNPDGYTQSRAGDESVSWSDAAGENAGTVYFTADEIDLLKGLAGKKPTISSVPVLAWGPQRMNHRDTVSAGYVPVPQGEPFPLFADPEGPW
jgi:hypothetical protein